MNWIEWLIVWHVFGAFITFLMWNYSSGLGAVSAAKGIEYVNPKHVYEYNKVNWFGAIVVSTLYGLFCPICTIGYWFYKLCTVGRK